MHVLSQAASGYLLRPIPPTQMIAPLLSPAGPSLISCWHQRLQRPLLPRCFRYFKLLTVSRSAPQSTRKLTTDVRRNMHALRRGVFPWASLASAWSDTTEESQSFWGYPPRSVVLSTLQAAICGLVPWFSKVKVWDVTPKTKVWKATTGRVDVRRSLSLREADNLEVLNQRTLGACEAEETRTASAQERAHLCSPRRWRGSWRCRLPRRWLPDVAGSLRCRFELPDRRSFRWEPIRCPPRPTRLRVTTERESKTMDEETG